MQISPTHLIFVASFCIHGYNGAEITLYEEADFGGNSTTINITGKECINLPVIWLERAVSVETKNNCIVAHPKANCSALEDSYRIDPDTNHNADLEYIDFHNEIQSFQLCPEPELESSETSTR
ncbi:unnamed protein product [Orchesella dallaii]|uniref:Uncharacterized protein n=1 Tax=Orchesella dallaii TaxID=48710 RepID=A0ABP1RLR7_9HEXA